MLSLCWISLQKAVGFDFSVSYNIKVSWIFFHLHFHVSIIFRYFRATFSRSIFGIVGTRCTYRTISIIASLDVFCPVFSIWISGNLQRAIYFCNCVVIRVWAVCIVFVGELRSRSSVSFFDFRIWVHVLMYILWCHKCNPSVIFARTVTGLIANGFSLR